MGIKLKREQYIDLNYTLTEITKVVMDSFISLQCQD